MLLLGTFAKLREATVSFVMSVRTSAWNNSASTISITKISLLESPRRLISEDLNLHQHRCENLKTCTIFSFYLTVVVVTKTNSSLLAGSQNCKRRLLASTCLSVSPSVRPSFLPSFLPAVCLSVRPREQSGSHWTDFHESLSTHHENRSRKSKFH